MINFIGQQIVQYKIDFGNNGSTLIAIGWLKNDGKILIGGNSRVAVDASKSEFLVAVDPNNINLLEEAKYTYKNYS